MNYGITVSGVRLLNCNLDASVIADKLANFLQSLDLHAVVEIWDEHRQELVSSRDILPQAQS